MSNKLLFHLKIITQDCVRRLNSYDKNIYLYAQKKKWVEKSQNIFVPNDEITTHCLQHYKYTKENFFDLRIRFENKYMKVLLLNSSRSVYILLTRSSQRLETNQSVERATNKRQQDTTKS